MRFYTWDDDKLWRVTPRTIREAARLPSHEETYWHVLDNSRVLSRWDPRFDKWENLPKDVVDEYGDPLGASSKVRVVHVGKMPQAILRWAEIIGA